MQTQPAKRLRFPRPQANKRQPDAKAQAAPTALKGGISGKPTTNTGLFASTPALLKKLMALDTETTGTDLWHGCKPFFVSTCDEQAELSSWRWDVHPLTREVGYWANPKKPDVPVNQHDETWSLHDISPTRPLNKSGKMPLWVKGPPKKDTAELKQIIAAYQFVLHNTKFDVRALEAIGLPRIDLKRVNDTLIGSHVLCSNEPHGLKEQALQYLDIRDDDQQELKEATLEARTIGRRLGWAIAQDGGHPHFPAQRKAPKAGWWVYDTWLPRVIAFFYQYPEDHPWWDVLERYALRDAERTLGLWWFQLDALEKEGLMEQYEERRQLLEHIYEMEHVGVTLSRKRLRDQDALLCKEARLYQEECHSIVRNTPPPGVKPTRGPHRPYAQIDNLNSSKQLQGLLYGTWKIRPGKSTATGYSTDAKTIETLLSRRGANELKPEQSRFLWCLLAYRGREKSRDYLEEYVLRALPSGTGWLVLHPSFNPTGTDTTRFSSSQPNAQNIGKGGKRDDDPIPSLRAVFGPAPGREWFSIDYSNIEMRIFSYKAEDQQLINTFETGYAVHLVFAEILFPTEFTACRKEALATLQGVRQGWGKDLTLQHKDVTFLAGDLFKKKYKTTLYQWTKNGNFALLYGAGKEKADSTYHRPGAYDLIRKSLPKVDEFMRMKDMEAKSYGYITCEGGYRLWVPPTEPHVAVNYYVQGTAGWCMVRSINRVGRYLQQLNKSLGAKQGTYKLTMTIHDELDFDFPKHERNKGVIEEIGRIMASAGDTIGLPTPVEISRHTVTWAEASAL